MTRARRRGDSGNSGIDGRAKKEKNSGKLIYQSRTMPRTQRIGHEDHRTLGFSATASNTSLMTACWA